MEPTQVQNYPLLDGVLTARGKMPQAMYSNQDVAALFGVGVRTIQMWIKKKALVPRHLPGKARFLAIDIEHFLTASKR